MDLGKMIAAYTQDNVLTKAEMEAIVREAQDVLHATAVCTTEEAWRTLPDTLDKATLNTFRTLSSGVNIDSTRSPALFTLQSGLKLEGYQETDEFFNHLGQLHLACIGCRRVVDTGALEWAIGGIAVGLGIIILAPEATILGLAIMGFGSLFPAVEFAANHTPQSIINKLPRF